MLTPKNSARLRRNAAAIWTESRPDVRQRSSLRYVVWRLAWWVEGNFPTGFGVKCASESLCDEMDHSRQEKHQIASQQVRRA